MAKGVSPFLQAAERMTVSFERPTEGWRMTDGRSVERQPETAARLKRLRGGTMRIAMIGSGYVGLVTGACLADFGHEVICVDKVKSKIAALMRY